MYVLNLEEKLLILDFRASRCYDVAEKGGIID